MPEIGRLIEFIELSNKVRHVQRKIAWREGGHENDAEHQYQLAITALYLVDSQHLELDKFRCAAMALTHDLVEAYAGDVSVFASKEDRAAKETREKEALANLKADWPEAGLIQELIDEYEARQTQEAKFVYALDKLLPEINNLLNGGRAWKEQGISMEQVEKIKAGKVDVDPIISAYHKQVMEMIRAQPELFKQ